MMSGQTFASYFWDQISFDETKIFLGPYVKISIDGFNSKPEWNNINHEQFSN